jgi:hypothetical protein
MIEHTWMTVTLCPNHWKLLRGASPQAARVAFHLQPERGRYGEEEESQKSCEEEEEVTSLHRPGQNLLPGPNAFWGY